MQPPPFDVQKDLDGWTLFWAELKETGGGEERLAELRLRVAGRARDRLTLETLSADPTVAALRRLFKEAGTDPSRYRPSSEALLRRLLKGGDLPVISPLVDINNCLSAELAVPCCVMAEGTFEPPLLWRSGAKDESYQSLRGPFKLEGKPLLCDAMGPLDAPITGNERVKVTADTHRAWLVAYLPSEAVPLDAAGESLEWLVGEAPVAEIVQTASS
jgi:DNA/RNA-binding domain of Phe-tRNA-synthetase-like protein